MTRLFGFYSSKAVLNGAATVFWKTPDGREVEVCEVTADPEANGLRWDDKVCVGEVTKFVRKGQPQR